MNPFTTAQWRHLYKMILIAMMRVDDDETERLVEIGVIIRRYCAFPQYHYPH